MDIYSNGKTSSRAQINSRTNRLLSVRAYNSGHLAVVVYYCYFFIFLFLFLFFFYIYIYFFLFSVIISRTKSKGLLDDILFDHMNCNFSNSTRGRSDNHLQSIPQKELCLWPQICLFWDFPQKKYEQKCSPWLAENNLRSLNQDV